MTGFDLKMERAKNKFTLAQVANTMNCSIGWLSEVENDKVSLIPKIVINYMDAINKLLSQKLEGVSN